MTVSPAGVLHFHLELTALIAELVNQIAEPVNQKYLEIVVVAETKKSHSVPQMKQEE